MADIQYTVLFLFDRTGQEVLLIEKARPEFQEGKWNGIGGKKEESETLGECAKREFREETGVQLENPRFFASLEGVDYVGRNFYVYFYYDMSDSIYEAKTQTDELVKIHSVNDLPVTLPNVRWLIEMALSFERGEGCRYFSIKEFGQFS